MPRTGILMMLSDAANPVTSVDKAGMREYIFTMSTRVKTRIGAQGQVVIPKKLRDRFGLLPNTEAEFIEEKGRLLVRPVVVASTTDLDVWDEVWGLLRHTIKDIDREIEEMRGR